MTKSKVLIIGVGHHAQRIHFPIVHELESAEVVAVVDLESEADRVQRYLASQKSAASVLFRDQTKLSDLHDVTSFAKMNKINSVIISTGPDTHTQYAKWALEHGYHVLMDKPVHAEKNAAHDVEAAKNIHEEYTSLIHALNEARKTHPNLVCEILTQRRFHPAYRFVHDVITEIFEKTNCPITYYYAFHNDGQWRMSDELPSIKYHGFDEGYGKASHSGYHFFDLLNWFTSDFQKERMVNNLLIKSWPNFPQNHIEQINDGVLMKVFPHDNVKQNRGMQKYGEIDVMSTIQLRTDASVVTHAQIDLLHSGISSRSWPAIHDRNLYKGNGRVRHEQHYIAIGPFASINLTSWQSKAFASEAIDSGQIYKPGHEFNLDITICRNTELVGGDEVETHSLTDFYKPTLADYARGHQEDARRLAISEFFELVNGQIKSGTSSLESHSLSSQIMSGVYESIASGTTVINKF